MGEDYIDVVGAQSVIEVAEVVAAVLGTRIEMAGEAGHLIVTTVSDPDLRVVIGLSIGDGNSDRGVPEMWTRRITITHQRTAADRHRWARHLHDALTARRAWTLTLSFDEHPGPPSA